MLEQTLISNNVTSYWIPKDKLVEKNAWDIELLTVNSWRMFTKNNY